MSLSRPSLPEPSYAIPGSDRHRVGAKTLEAWYYAWRREGIEGLVSKTRRDRHVSKLPLAVQEALLAAKREQPRRSIRQVQHGLEQTGVVAPGRYPDRLFIASCSSRASPGRVARAMRRKSIAALSQSAPTVSGMAMSCTAPRSRCRGNAVRSIWYR